MALFFKKKSETEQTLEDIQERLKDSDHRRDFFLVAVRSLLRLIKEFVLELKELDPDAFRQAVDTLYDQFTNEDDIKPARSGFDKAKWRILDYSGKQKAYIEEREAEFKDIIELLSTAMVSLSAENSEYHEKIYQQSEKIEEIILLDDIRRIKNALEQQVAQMRATVREKQAKEENQLEILSERVTVLSTELQKARAEALTDDLTGVANRKAYDRFIRDLVERNSLKKTPFALLFIDLDDFKRINDTFGHQSGDGILQSIARKCKENIRGDDFIGRYGGEEFVVVLPGAGLKHGVKKAKQLCKALAGTRYVIEGAPEEDPLKVTVSIGVSAIQPGDSIDSITQRADKALYAAKASGKNCVVCEKQLQ